MNDELEKELAEWESDQRIAINGYGHFVLTNDVSAMSMVGKVLDRHACAIAALRELLPDSEGYGTAGHRAVAKTKRDRVLAILRGEGSE